MDYMQNLIAFISEYFVFGMTRQYELFVSTFYMY